MLSVASVRSAAGAAGYFAQDNYYTVEGSAEMSVWAGAGAAALGLDGKVEKDAFEKILNGVLPSGEKVGQVENRRAGLDLTFSMPKSASILAYVTGDKRILTAHQAAVRSTMAWVEKNLAEGRAGKDGVAVRTGNLVYALFQHDTSRALDPQGHIHAVIANLTRMPDGKWQALHADRIWKANSIIGAISNAQFRANLEKLGYVVEPNGKHGDFRIVGVPRAVEAGFSQRRQDILEKAAELGVTSHAGRDRIAVTTRDPKLGVEDRDALARSWRERAAALGFSGRELVEAAERRAAAGLPASMMERGAAAIRQAVRERLAAIGAPARPQDPLVDRHVERSAASPVAARAQLATASAVRILSEREAAFDTHKLAKTALDLGLRGVTIGDVEARITRLIDTGQLIRGEGRAADMVTTPDALRTETAILGEIDAGRYRATPIVRAAEASARLDAASTLALNPDQRAAAVMILSSLDRIVTVQGDSGVGKSTMLAPVARVAEAEGRRVLGITTKHDLAGALRRDLGIEMRTIASFIHAHQRFIDRPEGPAFDQARAGLKGSLLVVDEASMIASDELLKIQQIGRVLGIDRIALVGDRKQIAAIGAGKSFSLIQADGGGASATMTRNLRQQTPQLRAVAELAKRGDARLAVAALGDRVVEAPDPAAAAARRWLALPSAERDATAVFTVTRAMRDSINAAIQQGLAANGALKGEGRTLAILERVNGTREELRHAASYRAGQILEVRGGGAREIGLRPGHYAVRGVRDGKVDLARGNRTLRIDPAKLSATDKSDRLQLFETRDIRIHENERIRWTGTDKKRDLLNAATARIAGVDDRGVTVELAGGRRLTLGKDDPMLKRIDLAYSHTIYSAQGASVAHGIVALDSGERFLTNQRLFYVAMTRAKQGLTLISDNARALVRQIARATGEKTSSLETIGKIDIDGKERAASAALGRQAHRETDQLAAAAELARRGEAGLALGVLGDRVSESASPAEAAAAKWLALPAATRDATAILASPALRATIDARIQEGLADEGAIRGEAVGITIETRVNDTRQALRDPALWREGQVLEVRGRGGQELGLLAGRYDVVGVADGKVALARYERILRIDPEKITPTKNWDGLQLLEKSEVRLHENEQIRWTADDPNRDILGAESARIVAVGAAGVTIDLAGGDRITLGLDDPMLKRLDLAHNLDPRMAAAPGADPAIVAIDTAGNAQANERLFAIAIAHAGDRLAIVTDDAARLGGQLDHAAGDRLASLETVPAAPGESLPASGRSTPGEGLGLDDSALKGWPDDVPLMPVSSRSDAPSPGSSAGARDTSAKAGPDRSETPPPFPERSLELGL